MWRCLCGRVQRNISERCDKCGRAYAEVAPYFHPMDLLDLAASVVMANTKSEVDEIKRKALEDLANDLPLATVATRLESSEGYVADQLALALRNLGVSFPPLARP